MKVGLSRAAGRDLDEIYTYTLNRWGSAQADQYLRSFEPLFRKLGSDPALGALTDIREGYRKLRHREHLIFYRILPGWVEIVRILHPRMDVSRHLA